VIKHRRKKWLWLLLIPAALLIIMQLKFKFATMVVTQLRVQTISCADPLFTSPPVVFEDLESITPLGNLNPPDHTLPTDHVYIGLPATPEASHNDDGLPPPAKKVTNVYAPGKIIITGIEKVEYLGSDGALLRQDFSMSFAVCRSVDGYYGHLSSLNPELEKLTSGKSVSCDQYEIDSAGARSVNSCQFVLGKQIAAGSVVGQAGEQFSSFDMGLNDNRAPAEGYANPKRYSRGSKTVCPFDYYNSGMKQKFASYFGMGTTRRTAAPVCGSVMQDKAGTAQGNWFFGDVKDGPQGWSKEVSLAHDNIDPSMGVISVGGTISQPFRLQFLPTHSGTTNREFAEIRPGPELYCYPSLADGYGIKRGQQLVLQLVDATSLKIEHQSGTCATNPAFTAAAKTYNR
jgi:hypothetical protein